MHCLVPKGEFHIVQLSCCFDPCTCHPDALMRSWQHDPLLYTTTRQHPNEVTLQPRIYFERPVACDLRSGFGSKYSKGFLAGRSRAAPDAVCNLLLPRTAKMSTFSRESQYLNGLVKWKVMARCQ